ncbi:MAG TPA: zinc-binding dehydrogenase [Gaiellales bacterium]|jgi:NADPH:quinone reductase-like Zn-dependent oxidoreductase|nr:zinc-binding dehydrogenase [Gaiellales bacterium]
MRAVILSTPGGPAGLRAEERPDPRPAPGEVVVELRTAALNHRDVWTRENPSTPRGSVLGSDGAGTVVEHGAGASGPPLGSEVVINPSVHWGDREDAPGPDWSILGVPRMGTYAERIAIPADHVRPRPGRLTWQESAALPLAGLTAWRALVTRGGVGPGTRLLVTAAGAGVSTFLVQIARELGATVVVTSSSHVKIERAIELGADRGVLYTDDDWPEQVGEVDVVIDSAGAPAWNGALRCLRRGGTLVSFGRTAGERVELDIPQVYFGQWNLLGTTMGSPREFDALLEHLARARWRPVIDSVFPLEEAAAAHERLLEPGRFGKVVLEIAP